MEKKVRILQLSPRFPFPEDDGGKIGIANIYKQFSQQADNVSLFTYTEKKIKEDLVVKAEEYGDVHIYRQSTRNTPGRIFLTMLRNESLYLKKHINENVKKYIAQLISSVNFNIIHVDHTAMAPLGYYIKSITGAPLGMRLHNIEYKIWERYYYNLPNWHPGKFYIKRQADILKRKEGEYFANADVCFAITEEDKQIAQKIAPKANVTVASAGVNIEDWAMGDIQRDNKLMVLATTYKWRHNVDAVKWLLDKVIPLVRKEVPDAKLNLLGKDPPDFFKDYADLGVNVQGYVDTIKPHLNKASVYVAPLFTGSGIRIKILEAMASGLPVVATPVSAEGINASEEQGLIIKNNEKDFAESVVYLFNHPQISKKMGITAHNYVKENFSWNDNVKIMIDEYKKLL